MGRTLIAYLAELRRHAGSRLTGVALLAFVAAALEGAGVVMLFPLIALTTGDGWHSAGLIARLHPANPEERALVLLAIFLAVLALRARAGWRRDLAAQRLSHGFVDATRLRLVERIANAPWLQVAGLRRASIEHALTNDVERLAAGTELLLAALTASLLVAVQFAILGALSPQLALLTAALLALGGLLAIPVMRRVSGMGARLTRGGRNVHGVLGDFLEGQKLARLSDRQGDFVDRLDSALCEMRGEELAYVASQAAARGWLQFIAGSIAAGALVVGAFWLHADVAVLGVLVVVLVRLVGPLQSVLQAAQGMAYMLPAFADLQAMEAELTQVGSTSPVTHEASEARGPAGLALESIRFAYGRKPVLDGLSLSIEPGEFVALSGASGAGKTTLLDIVCGLIEPQHGSVSGDGIALVDAASRQAWRGRIACVPQDPYLFDASLRENLSFAAEADEAAIIEAIEKVGAAEWVAGLPEGLDTRAGPRGSAFSGGERQRICLARALLRRPGLLILDEATNALDRASEAALLERLKALRSRMTILLVSHRDSALAHADRVIRLEGGRVVG